MESNPDQRMATLLVRYVFVRQNIAAPTQGELPSVVSVLSVLGDCYVSFLSYSYIPFLTQSSSLTPPSILVP